jgi:glycosyltransferase involved in cell wall biosynthesis
VLNGLTGAWLDDSRVDAVFAAIPEGMQHPASPPGVEFVPVAERAWPLYVGRGLRRTADRVGADVIFSPNATPPRDARAVLYFQDLKHVRRSQDEALGARARAGEFARTAWREFSAPSCLLGVAVSDDIASEVRRQLPITTVMIPNGVNVNGTRWSGVGDHVFVMGGIGPWKGEETALRAWARVSPELHTVVTLEICGAEPGERRAKLERLAGVLGIASSTQVIGILPRARFLERMATSRLALSCSRFEAFGLPVAEALAICAPVLCSDLPAHRELIARAGGGELFPVGDTDSLATRIEGALRGHLPNRLTMPPPRWQWADRAREHIDAYATTLAARFPSIGIAKRATGAR